MKFESFDEGSNLLSLYKKYKSEKSYFIEHLKESTIEEYIKYKMCVWLEEKDYELVDKLRYLIEEDIFDFPSDNQKIKDFIIVNAGIYAPRIHKKLWTWTEKEDLIDFVDAFIDELRFTLKG